MQQFSAFSAAGAPAGDLYGRFYDDRYNTPIANATIQLLPKTGDGVLARVSTDAKGDFRFVANGRRQAGHYRLQTYIGGRPFYRKVVLFEDDVSYDLHRTVGGGLAGLSGTYYRNHGLSAFGDLGAVSCAQREAGIRRGRCQARRAQWDAAVAAGCTPSRSRPSCPGGGMAGGGFAGVLSAIADAAGGAVETAKSAVSSVPTPLLLAGAAGAAYLLLRKKRR